LDYNKIDLTLAFLFAGIALLVFIISFSDKTVEAVATTLWLTVSVILFFEYFTTKRKNFIYKLPKTSRIPVIKDKSKFEERKQLY